jgi:5-(carboxyamino)imidazole ribonucleotide mutase
VAQTKPSKTARKREYLLLQELGERLVGFTAGELQDLPLDERLREAVLAASAMTSKGALRRQKQLIGKLMRDADADAIRQALDARSADDRIAKRTFAEAERWRDRIVSEGHPAIMEYQQATGATVESLGEMVAELQLTANERVAKTIRRRIFQNVHSAMTQQVGIIMGSQSDWETMRHASETLDQLGVSHEVRVVSAHRTPDLLFEYAGAALERGLKVIIAGAGGAAHLPGMTAAKTRVPVLGVPVQSKALSGQDSLLSIVQMPAGIPVGTMAIGKAGAINAALLAAAIVANDDTDVASALDQYRQDQTDRVLANPDPRS